MVDKKRGACQTKWRSKRQLRNTKLFKCHREQISSYSLQGGSVVASSLSRKAFRRWLLSSDSELLQSRTSSSFERRSKGERPLEFRGEQLGGGGAGGRSSSRDFDLEVARGLRRPEELGFALSRDCDCSVNLKINKIVNFFKKKLLIQKVINKYDKP